MSASIKKKSKPKSDKVATNKQTNKQQQQQTTIFFAKNKSIFETNFTKFEGKVRFGQFFFENDPFDEPNQMPLSKKCYLFRKLVKIAK